MIITACKLLKNNRIKKGGQLIPICPPYKVPNLKSGASTNFATRPSNTCFISDKHCGRGGIRTTQYRNNIHKTFTTDFITYNRCSTSELPRMIAEPFSMI